MITCGRSLGSPPSLGVARPRGPGPRGGRRGHEASGADHVGDADVVGAQHAHLRDVAEDSERRSPRPRPAPPGAAAVAEARAAPRRPAWSRGGEGLGVERGQRAAVGVDRQRARSARRRSLRLILTVYCAAWDRRPRRRRCGAARTARRRGHGRCPSGATPWRRSWRPRRGSGGRGAPAAGVQLGHHGAVHERLVEASPNTASSRSTLPVFEPMYGAWGRPVSRPLLISTMEPLGPGTEPRTQQQVLARRARRRPRGRAG